MLFSVLVSIMVFPLVVIQAPADAPDLVLINGRIYTVDDANTVCDAIAIRGERILAVGSAAAMQALAGPETRVIDLEGRTVVPGFIDAHGHIAGLGQAMAAVDLTGASSYGELIDRVRAKAERLPAGEWLLGRGWDQNRWPGGAFPHHAELSAATPDHPVFLVRVDGHAALANARALERAGIGVDTGDPPGGRIIRGSDGRPAGVLIDTAQGMVSRRIPSPTDAQVRDAMIAAMTHCLALGITTVHDAGVDRRQLAIYEDLVQENAMAIRIYALISGGDRNALDAWFERGPRIEPAGFLTVRSIKLMADGALGSRGAALIEPYSDEPESTGLLIMSGSRVQALTERALLAGFQVCTHAIGDRANREVLDAYAAAMAKAPEASDPRLRIEHAQIIAPDDIPRFAELGVVASMQATHAASDMPWAATRVGPGRLQGAYAWRTLMDTGARIANGSDFPVENANPLWGFYAAITRQDHEGQPEGGWRPSERMTRIEALRSFTIDAAYAAFEENEKGSLEPGKLADLVVLSDDIMAIAPNEILNTVVNCVVMSGRMAYER